MSTLKELAQQIKTEKDTKIIPNNIKKDVQIFDILGALEGGGGASGIKKYDSILQMRADTTAEIGDLGVVFGTTTIPVGEDTVFSSLIFADTVVIPETVNEWISETFRNVGSGTEHAECHANIYNENNIYTFTFRGNSSSGEIDEVKYTSQDGLNFTKVSGERNVDIGINVKRFAFESRPFNTVFSYFLKTETNDFQGLYTYTENIPNDNKFKLYDVSTVNFNLDTSSTYWDINGITMSFLDRILEVDKIQTCINNYLSSHTAPTHTQGCVFIGLDDEVYYIPNNVIDLAYNESKEYIGSYVFWRESFEVYQLDLDNGTCTLSETIPSPSSYIKKDNYSTYYYTTQLKAKTTSVRIYNENGYNLSISRCTVNIACGNTSKGAQNGRVSDLRVLENTYINAKTQLSASPDYVLKDKVFMGSNQVETGTLTNNISNNFTDANAKVYEELLSTYQNMPPIVINNRSEINKSIKAIPTKLDGTSLLDLSHMNNAYGVFMGCRFLKYVPTLNVSNTNSVQSIFYECTSLVEVANFDTSNINVGYSMFYNCYSLKSIPNIDTSKMNNMYSMLWRCSNITSLPALNTSKVTDMSYAFKGCENLQNVPLLNSSNINTMPSVFKNCFNLTNDSLNNILSMCASATKINSSNRTLNYIGLTQNQANICKNLSNYSTFTAAGWTAGY